MEHPIVRVHDLRRTYARPLKAPGLRGALRAFVRREVERVAALDGVSWDLGAGEILGYVGPNGAGKTTTLKILAGVLYPSSGEVSVLGHCPWHRESAFLHQISYVMSGRGLLEEVAWDLSVRDGLEFVRDLYSLAPATYGEALEELVALLDLADLLDAPLRQLSHGQRRRAELAGALLWRPRLLLLDEPTLGLDVLAQAAIRRFVRAYVGRHGAACVVTSHYMRDIEELAGRVILIDRGRVVAEGSPQALVARVCTERLIRLELEQETPPETLARYGQLLEHSGLEATLQVPAERARAVAQELLQGLPVRDIRMVEMNLEDAMQRFFGNGTAGGTVAGGTVAGGTVAEERP